MTILAYFGYSLTNILVLLLSGAITGCGIAVGFDIWKRFKSYWQDRKNKKYKARLEEEALAAAAT